MRALVIDDCPVSRLAHSAILRGLGFHVVDAGSGDEGLDRLAELGSPDAVAVDWRMPGMSGLEFVRAVRADPRYAGVPIIMVTSETDLGRVRLALAEGVSEYVMKPVDREAMRSKLQLVGVTGCLP